MNDVMPKTLLTQSVESSGEHVSYFHVMRCSHHVLIVEIPQTYRGREYKVDLIHECIFCFACANKYERYFYGATATWRAVSIVNRAVKLFVRIRVTERFRFRISSQLNLQKPTSYTTVTSKTRTSMRFKYVSFI